MPRRGRAVAASASPALIRSAVFGPTPGTSETRPASAASREPGDRSHVERLPELAHPLRRHPQKTSHADELRHRLGLELTQLRQLAGRHELVQARLDAWADAGQLAHSPRAHELGDVDGCRADQLGGPPVGANRVVAGAGQVEQGREGLQPLGQ